MSDDLRAELEAARAEIERLKAREKALGYALGDLTSAITFMDGYRRFDPTIDISGVFRFPRERWIQVLEARLKVLDVWNEGKEAQP